MVHRAFGRIPLVNETGADFTRSAAGRLVSEMIWTPAVALDPAVTWMPVDDDTATADPADGPRIGRVWWSGPP
jgi:hypothetical protein